MRRVLVIKLGALGDFVHAFHAFAAIRAHHAGSAITLLTTAPFRDLAQASPWFDEVLVDPRAPWWNLPATRRTAQMLRGFDFTYDLQTSRRSGRYFNLAGRPPWSGIALGCSHPHANPQRDFMHTLERQREQLYAAGITEHPLPERDWLIRLGQRHGITDRYALLVPGGAGLGSVKRWPADRYAAAAKALQDRALQDRALQDRALQDGALQDGALQDGALQDGGLNPVIIGGPAEAALARTILAACPEAVDLTGKTSIPDIAALAAGAVLVLGNDTGPVQLAASVGAPTLALFSAATVPEQVAPRGPNGEWATVLRVPDLNALPVAEVMAAVRALLAG